MKLTEKILIGLLVVSVVCILGLGVGKNIIRTYENRVLIADVVELCETTFKSVEGLYYDQKLSNINFLELQEYSHQNRRILLAALKILSNRTEPEFNYEEKLKSSVIVSEGTGFGSGTVIKVENNFTYILTCYHVVKGAMESKEKTASTVLTVSYNTYTEDGEVDAIVAYGAEIVKLNEEYDLALIRIYTIDPYLQVSQIATKVPNKGDTVYAIGNPLGIFNNVSKGILCNKVNGDYVTDSTTTFGNSGGTLYNADGEVIGVPAYVGVYDFGVTGQPIPESSLGFSVGVTKIRTFLGEDFLRR